MDWLRCFIKVAMYTSAALCVVSIVMLIIINIT